MDRGGRIDRRTSASRWLESYLLGSPHCGFIEAIAESARYSQHFNLTGCGEKDANQDFAFDLLVARLFGVVRTRLERDFNRSRAVFHFALARSSHRSGGSRIAEPALLNRRLASATVTSGVHIACDSIAEASACDNRSRAFGSACAVTGAGTDRQVK